MKALCWYGKNDVRINDVTDPKIEDPHDAIVKVTSTAICGSDLHLYNNLIPTLESGDILGHEFMGEVVEVGANNKKLKVGDRVVVPFTISCGKCAFCKKGLFAICDRSNRNAEIARQKLGQSPAGMFGYSHMLGGYAGGQAEYVRIPFADVGPIKISSKLKDEQVLFLSDIFPTGYMAAENCNIEKGDTVAIWGCGPVGQFCIRSAKMLGAERIIAIDRIPERLAMAKKVDIVEVIDRDETNVQDALMQLTKGKGPDKCIDAVGTEAHAGNTLDAIMERVKVAVSLVSDRANVLREAIQCCKKGGIISIPGVYIGTIDNIPFGIAMNKGLTFKMGQTHVQHYLKPLLKKIEMGEIDPSFVITHKHTLDEAPLVYKKFNAREEGYIKVILNP